MRKLYLATCFFIAIAFQSNLFSQPFKLLKDINGGVLYDMARPVNLIESGGSMFFRVGYPYTSSKNRGPQEGFWKSDGTDAGTLQIKGVSAVETMETLVEINGTFYFTIYNTSTFISELWKSDGTPPGTVLIRTWPASNQSYLYRAHNLTPVNDILYFVIRTANEQDELWKSDGTPAGTIALKSSWYIENMISVSGTLFFTAAEVALPYHRLWKSDGTELGTVLVKDIFAGVAAPYFSNFYDANGILFFSANDQVNGSEVWKSDGTGAGTVMIKNLGPGANGSNPRSFIMADGNVYFFATVTGIGDALWKSDGTPDGTVMIKDLADNDYSYAGGLINVNGLLFFAGVDDINGSEVWKSDGTEAGTILLKDVASGSRGSAPNSLGNVNGVLYFAVTGDPGANEVQIWKSDGSEAGTVLVKGGYKGTNLVETIQFVEANGLVFFTAYEGINGQELQKTDGTPGGTAVVKNVTASPGSDARNFVTMGGLVYFSAFNSDSGPGINLGRDLYKTDGTFGGTISLPINSSQGGSNPLDMATHNSELFISGQSRNAGHELWKSTGGLASRLKDINPSDPNVFGNPGSNPGNFKSAGQYLFFSATNPTYGNELWKSDGTETGTVLVKDINPTGNSDPQNIVNIGGVVYFAANNGTNGLELWKSDGTEAGTFLVKDINGSGNSNPANLVNLNGVLYFTADNGIDGIELWKSDGNEAGTMLVKNINAGSNSSNPSSLAAVNGLLYFAADNGINGMEVWKSDGTIAGTVLVKDIFPGDMGSNPSLFTNLNGIALFAADNGSDGRELWKSNGTAAGTIIVKDIQPGGQGSNPTVLTILGNLVLFGANDGVHGNEVWLSNGVEQGTRLMSEIQPGINSADPTAIFAYGPKVLVAATGPMVGNEIWIADVPADIPTQPEATITASGPLTICTGQSVQLQANTGADYTYQWKKAAVNIAGATQSNYTANLAGYYTVEVTDAGGSSATSEVVILTVVNPPLATVAAAGPLTFCAGKNVLLKAITGTGYTYQWKKAGVSIDNATQSTYTATVAGIYSVLVSNATGCSTISSPINVIVNAVPLATVAVAGPLTFCEGKNVQLKAITGTGYSYQWKRGGADIAGATLSNYTAITTGIYSVVVTNAGGCSTTSAAFNVVVKPLPVAIITPSGSTTFCSGKNVLLKANTGTNYTYQWIRGAAVIPDAVQSSYAATLPGQYTVIVTNSSGCSVTSAGIPVSVTPLPAALISPAGPLTFCAGQSVSLKANTGTNYTYQWKKAGINIPGATLVSYTASVSGVYSVVVTNAAGCPVTSPGVTVTVNSVPLATVVAAGATSFCAGKNVLLKAINGTGYTYQWKKNGISIPQETTSKYTATATGIYSVVVTNATGCSSTSIGIGVTVIMAPLATVAVAGPPTFCEGKNVLLKAVNGTGYTYQWKKNGVNIAAQTQSNYTATATGVYIVMVTNAEGCSTLSTGITVTVTPAPAAIITANGPLTFPQGGNVMLNASAAAGNVYQWKKDGVNIVGAASENYTATSGGTYTVVITNAGGCQAVSQPTVVVVTQGRAVTKNFHGGEDIIKVYPNPIYRNDYLNVDWNFTGADKGVLVTIYDMAGRKINSRFLTANNRTIKITGASGMYLVECRWGINKRKVFSVIKIE